MSILDITDPADPSVLGGLSNPDAVLWSSVLAGNPRLFNKRQRRPQGSDSIRPAFAHLATLTADDGDPLRWMN